MNKTKNNQYPQIHPHYYVAPLDEGRLLFRSALGAKVVRARGPASHLLEIIHFLNGKYSVAELSHALPHHSTTEIQQTICLLNEAGLLKNLEQPCSVDMYQDQKILFSLLRTGESEDHFQEKLQRSCLGIIGCNALGATIAFTLANAGVRRFILHDEQVVTPADIGMIFSLKDVGQSRNTALSEKLKISYPDLEFEKRTEAIKSAEDCKAFIDSTIDVLAVCQDRVNPNLWGWVNVACLETLTRWLPVWLEGPFGYTGPMIVPHQTACFNCMQIRRQEALDNFKEYSAFDKYTCDHPDRLISYGTTAALFGIVGNLAAWEIFLVLSGVQQPTAQGKLLKFDGTTSEVRSHPIWKFPRCPTCSRSKHMRTTKTWEHDLQFK